MSALVIHRGRVPVGGIGQDGPVINLQAVLFDMDGTLIDSEKVWEVALNDLAESYGGVLTHQARIAMVGASSERTMEILLADLDQQWRDPVEGADWLDARVLGLFAAGLDWRPGAQELLARVRAAGLKTALVTNTRRALVEVALGTLGAHNFDLLVCGDEVPRTKPDPAPYLAAASGLGVDPAACVAIEDSPAGIASALAAGCAIVAVPNEVALDDVAGLEDGLVLASLVDVDVATLAGLVSHISQLHCIDIEAG
jgi:HAD superfamily hydrolase (TIGR01509 family)